MINQFDDLIITKYLDDIYTKIFRCIEEQYIIVFLCGGASTKQKKSLRDKIRILLEKDKSGKSKYSKQLPVKVFYPEDLLMDVLNITKNADLLSYEQFLASNSHVIAIICESSGSLVELGAFTNNKYTVNKVIAAVDKKRTKDKSFIMLGPIKYLKKKNRLNVVTYTSDEDKLARDLLKSIRWKYSITDNNRRIRLNTIVGMHYFIQLLLYFFKRINSRTLVEMIRAVVQDKKIEMTDFDVLFSAALKLLFYDGQIIKTTGQKYAVYELTHKGYRTIKEIIAYCTSRDICDSIRIGIMYFDFYKSPLS